MFLTWNCMKSMKEHLFGDWFCSGPILCEHYKQVHSMFSTKPCTPPNFNIDPPKKKRLGFPSSESPFPRGFTTHFQVVPQPLNPEAWSSVLLGLAVAGLTAKLVRETQVWLVRCWKVFWVDYIIPSIWRNYGVFFNYTVPQLYSWHDSLQMGTRFWCVLFSFFAKPFMPNVLTRSCQTI